MNDSQLFKTQQLIDTAQESYPDAYVEHVRGLNRVIWLESQDNPDAWGIEIGKDYWLLPFKAAPYTPFYPLASKDIGEVLNTIGLLMEVDNADDSP